jgi:hypothetical protein
MCQKIVEVLWIILFLWVFSGCAHQHPSLKVSHEKSSAPMVIKPEAPVEPAPELPARKPEMPIEPKSETNKVAPENPSLNISTAPPSKSGLYVHKVRWSEETLSHIAKWYTGTVKNWKAIAKVNPELDPKKIDTGDTIFIPEDLLISRKPMPLSFVHRSIHKTVKQTLSPDKTARPSDSPKLFGPIYTESPPVKSDAAKLFGPVE